MFVHVERQPVCQGVDGIFHSGILHRPNVSALAAHHMVMVLASGVSGLVPGGATTQLDAVHQAQPGERLKRPVHARNAGAAILCRKGVVDLLRGQAAVLVREQVDNRAPGPAGAQASVAHGLLGMARPGGAVGCGGHGVNDRRPTGHGDGLR